MEDMRHFEPTTVDEAVALLAGREDAKCLAGGASLVAMMNARLVEPPALVSLRRIDALKEFETNSDGSMRIGAAVRHCEIAADDRLAAAHLVVRRAAASIANPVIREMGTIGGAVSHFDPAADYPSALVAVDAEIEIARKGSRHSLPAAAFFLDWYTTVLQPGDLVTAVVLPPQPAGSTGVHDKLAKVQGDMGIAMVSLVLAEAGGFYDYLAVSVGGCGPTPIRLPDKERALIGPAPWTGKQ